MKLRRPNKIHISWEKFKYKTKALQKKRQLLKYKKHDIQDKKDASHHKITKFYKELNSKYLIDD